MWIRSQDGTQILKVERFRSVTKDNGDVNILAKLDRETVCLGTYCHEQAESIMKDLWFEATRHLHQKDYAMPERWEEEYE